MTNFNFLQIIREFVSTGKNFLLFEKLDLSFDPFFKSDKITIERLININFN